MLQSPEVNVISDTCINDRLRQRIFRLQNLIIQRTLHPQHKSIILLLNFRVIL